MKTTKIFAIPSRTFAPRELLRTLKPLTEEARRAFGHLKEEHCPTLDFSPPTKLKLITGYELRTFPPSSNMVWISDGKSRVLIGTNTGYVHKVYNPPIFRIGAFWRRMQDVVDYFNGKEKPQSGWTQKLKQGAANLLKFRQKIQARG